MADKEIIYYNLTGLEILIYMKASKTENRFQTTKIRFAKEVLTAPMVVSHEVEQHKSSTMFS